MFYSIVCKQPSGTVSDFAPGNYEFGIFGPLYLWYQTGTGDSEEAFYESTFPVTVSTWQHVAVTLKKGDSVKFYINGIPAGIFPQTEQFGVVNNEPVRIGNMKSNDVSFYGTIDDVRIYDTALTADEVTLLYQEGQ
jgi:hypothetical protein